jgi:hypothetical protein
MVGLLKESEDTEDLFDGIASYIKGVTEQGSHTLRVATP